MSRLLHSSLFFTIHCLNAYLPNMQTPHVVLFPHESSLRSTFRILDRQFLSRLLHDIYLPMHFLLLP